MSRSTQLQPDRYDELLALIAAGASYETAARQLGVSVNAVRWRLKKLGIQSTHSSGRPPAGQERDPRIPGGRRRPSKDDSEFSGQETMYCHALDRGTPEPCAAKLAGFGEGVPPGVYQRWQNRRARQL